MRDNKEEVSMKEVMGNIEESMVKINSGEIALKYGINYKKF